MIGLPQPTSTRPQAFVSCLSAGKYQTQHRGLSSTIHVVPPQYHVSQSILEMTTRRLSWASIAIFLLSIISFHHKALVKGDAAFIDVRTKLEKDRSGKRGDSKDKYFRKIFASGCRSFAMLILRSD